MTLSYGVLRARFDRVKREDGAATPHLQIRAVDSSGQPWRIAVNVESDDGSEVVFWVVDPLVGHPILAALAAMASGFTHRRQVVGVTGLRQSGPSSTGRWAGHYLPAATPMPTTCRTC